MSYNYLSDPELLRVAEDSDSALARELAARFDKLIAAHEEALELLDAYHDLLEDAHRPEPEGEDVQRV